MEEEAVGKIPEEAEAEANQKSTAVASLGEKLSKDIIWPLKPLKSKERQEMSMLHYPVFNH